MNLSQELLADAGNAGLDSYYTNLETRGDPAALTRTVLSHLSIPELLITIHEAYSELCVRCREDHANQHVGGFDDCLRCRYARAYEVERDTIGRLRDEWRNAP